MKVVNGLLIGGKAAPRRILHATQEMSQIVLPQARIPSSASILMASPKISMWDRSLNLGIVLGMSWEFWDSEKLLGAVILLCDLWLQLAAMGIIHWVEVAHRRWWVRRQMQLAGKL